jgi:hypothetical protein
MKIDNLEDHKNPLSWVFYYVFMLQGISTTSYDLNKLNHFVCARY